VSAVSPLKASAPFVKALLSLCPRDSASAGRAVSISLNRPAPRQQSACRGSARDLDQPSCGHPLQRFSGFFQPLAKILQTGFGKPLQMLFRLYDNLAGPLEFLSCFAFNFFQVPQKPDQRFRQLAAGLTGKFFAETFSGI